MHVRAGDRLSVKASWGQRFMVEVPAGLKEGDTFEAELAAAEQHRRVRHRQHGRPEKVAQQAARGLGGGAAGGGGCRAGRADLA
mgnify:CR=1 FL=1